MTTAQHGAVALIVCLAACEAQTPPEARDAGVAPRPTHAPLDPQKVAPDPPADRRAIAVDGGTTSCAVLHDGTVWCWGSDAQGELGWDLPLTTNWPYRSLPTRVFGVEGASQVATSRGKVCAIVTEGHVWCWGAERNKRVLATRIPDIEGAVQLEMASYKLTCAVMNSGKVACWKGVVAKPRELPGGGFAEVMLSGGRRNDPLDICFRTLEDEVVCSLFDQTTLQTRERKPMPVEGGAVSLAALSDRICATRRDGMVACWRSDMPAPNVMKEDWLDGHVVAIDRACALTNDGVLRCKARDDVVTRSDVIAFSGRCAISRDGNIACLGPEGYSDVAWTTPAP